MLLALVFMLLLSMVAATVLQSAILQLHMAGNDQFKEEALYRAQAIVAELSLEPENFSLQGDVGRTNCPPGDDSPQCHQHSLQLPTSAQALEGYALDIRVTRQDPLLWRGFPIRENEHEVSSSNRFDAAIFEVDVHVDGSEARLGSAHIVQGVAVRVPAFRQ
ncbi:Uncharacterised protein [Halioglobus japonicus]|nr:Uncharacterised protein [Halioglobus japonicus]